MQPDKKRFYRSLLAPTLWVAIIWLIHLARITFEIDAIGLGVHSRHLDGVLGIFTSPFIHGSFSHLFNNSFPLLVSGVAIFYFFPKVSGRSLTWMYLFTGIAVWLFARPVYHIGASGVVYAFISFIFWSGVFRRNNRSIILALVVIIMYSGMLAGLIPDPENHISWESHLLGLIVGAITAYVYKDELEPDEIASRQNIYGDEDDEPKEYFLPRDVFEKTKEQRRREAEELLRGGWDSDSTFIS